MVIATPPIVYCVDNIIQYCAAIIMIMFHKSSFIEMKSLVSSGLNFQK